MLCSAELSALRNQCTYTAAWRLSTEFGLCRDSGMQQPAL